MCCSMPIGSRWNLSCPHLPEGQRWARLVDTGRPAPEDFVDPPVFLSDGASTCLTEARSAVILVARSVTTSEKGV